MLQVKVKPTNYLQNKRHEASETADKEECNHFVEDGDDVSTHLEDE